MKKIIPFVFLSLITILSIKAQSRDEGDGKHVFISVGPGLGIPNNSPFSISYGGEAKVEVKVMPQLGITLAGGYDIYHYKNSILNSYQIANIGNPAFVPLKVGAKYYLGPAFYAAGELGSAIGANNGAANLFEYTIGFGFDIKLNTISDIDVGFRYEGYSQRAYQVTGIGAAYRLGW